MPIIALLAKLWSGSALEAPNILVSIYILFSDQKERLHASEVSFCGCQLIDAS